MKAEIADKLAAVASCPAVIEQTPCLRNREAESLLDMIYHLSGVITPFNVGNRR